MPPDNSLIEWAKREGFTLRPAEWKLLVNVIKGKPVDGKTGLLSKRHHKPDLACPEDQIIRADLLSKLILDKEAKEHIHPYGIRIHGVYIEGGLNLDTASIPFPLVLQDCYIPGIIDLRDANTRLVSFRGSHTGQIRASRIIVESSLVLNEGFWAKGEVRLHGAHIKGQFDCRYGRFDNPINNPVKQKSVIHEKNEHALMADDIKVDCDVYLTGIRARGAVSFAAAQIGDDLQCEGGHFINRKGKAFAADRIHVDGNIYFNFFNGDEKHKATPFWARGQVSLRQAVIKGGLFCRSAFLLSHKGKGQIVLDATEATIAGSAWFNGVKTNGLICLRGSIINDCLYFSNTSFIGKHRTGLMGTALNVKHRFVWTSINDMEDRHVSTLNTSFELDLRYARLGRLQDEERSWPAPGNLMLEGLKYKSIISTLNTKKRKEWLDLQMTERLTVVDIDDLSVLTDKIFNHKDPDKILDPVTSRLKSRLLEIDIDRIKTNIQENGSPSQIDKEVLLQGLNDLLQDQLLYEDFCKAKESFLKNTPKGRKRQIKQCKKKVQAHQGLTHLNCWILKTVYPKLIHEQAQPRRYFTGDQPYEHLASFLMAHGMDDEAKEILIAKNDAKLNYGDLPRLAKFWMGRYKCMTEYGYRPFKAALKGLVFIFIGGLFFWSAYEEGFMVPSKEYVYMNEPYRTNTNEKTWDLKVNGEIPSTYPEFDPFVYSLDVFVPFFDLHQKAYWLPLPESDDIQEHELRKKALEHRDFNPFHIKLYNALVNPVLESSQIKPLVNAILSLQPLVNAVYPLQLLVSCALEHLLIKKDSILLGIDWLLSNLLHLWMWLEIIIGWLLSTFFVTGILGLMHETHHHQNEE